MKNYNQSLLQEEEISNLAQFQVGRTTSQMPDEDEETDDIDDEEAEREALQAR